MKGLTIRGLVAALVAVVAVLPEQAVALVTRHLQAHHKVITVVLLDREQTEAAAAVVLAVLGQQHQVVVTVVAMEAQAQTTQSAAQR